MKKLLASIVVLIGIGLIAGCGGGSTSTTGATTGSCPTGTESAAASLSAVPASE